MTIRVSVTVNDAERMVETRYEAEVEFDRSTTPEQAEATLANTLRMLDRQATEGAEAGEEDDE